MTAQLRPCRQAALAQTLANQGQYGRARLLQQITDLELTLMLRFLQFDVIAKVGEGLLHRLALPVNADLSLPEAIRLLLLAVVDLCARLGDPDCGSGK